MPKPKSYFVAKAGVVGVLLAMVIVVLMRRTGSRNAVAYTYTISDSGLHELVAPDGKRYTIPANILSTFDRATQWVFVADPENRHLIYVPTVTFVDHPRSDTNCQATVVLYKYTIDESSLTPFWQAENESGSPNDQRRCHSLQILAMEHGQLILAAIPADYGAACANPWVDFPDSFFVLDPNGSNNPLRPYYVPAEKRAVEEAEQRRCLNELST